MQSLNTNSLDFKRFQTKCMTKSIRSRIDRAHENMDKRHAELMQSWDDLIEVTRNVNQKLAAQS